MATAVASFAAGIVLGVLGIVGVVSAVTPNANSASVSNTAVTYDSR